LKPTAASLSAAAPAENRRPDDAERVDP
jgi:hypothetical protein